MKGLIKGIIIGLVIAIIGVVALIVAYGMNGWKRLPNEPEFEMQTFTAEERHTALDLNIDARFVKAEFYDGDKITVEYPAAEGFITGFKENGETLVITSRTKWTSLSSCVSTNTYTVPTITVKLPYGIYDLKLDMDAGSVTLADGEYGKISLDIDAGVFDAGSIKCTSFDCDIDAGTVSISSLECAETLKCNMDAGKIDIFKLTCPDTDFDLDAGAAKINFTGDRSDYTISVKKSAGSCNVGNQSGTTAKVIKFKIDAGSVTVTFNN